MFVNDTRFRQMHTSKLVGLSWMIKYEHKLGILVFGLWLLAGAKCIISQLRDIAVGWRQCCPSHYSVLFEAVTTREITLVDFII